MTNDSTSSIVSKVWYYTQLQIASANLAGLIDLTATIPFQCIGAVSGSYELAAVSASDILGHGPNANCSMSNGSRGGNKMRNSLLTGV
jgi:hypothetical protein